MPNSRFVEDVINTRQRLPLSFPKLRYKGGAVVRALTSRQCGAVRILESTPYVGWVCCWFSRLLREVFLRVQRFSPLLKNQHFQIPIRSGTHGHVSTSSYELLSDPWVNKLQFTIFLQFTVYKYSLLEFNSRETCQYLMNWTRWDKRDKVWSSATSPFKWRFRSRRRHCLSSLVS